MKFIIDTHDLEVSKSRIETLLENELDNPISVKEVEEINEEKLDELAEEFCDEEYEHPTDVNKAQNGLELGYSNLVNCFKAGYRTAKEE